MKNKHPQTRAVQIGRYGCLAMCYLYCSGIKPDNAHYFKLISDAMDVGLLDDECTVLNAEKFIFYASGRRCKVKKDVCNKSNFQNYLKPFPIKYGFGTSGHWVVCRGGEIIFNPLEKSVSVNQGEPCQVRVIEWDD